MKPRQFLALIGAASLLSVLRTQTRDALAAASADIT